MTTETTDTAGDTAPTRHIPTFRADALLIKRMSLADEARIIRKLERKLKRQRVLAKTIGGASMYGARRYTLYAHRVHIVRVEARAAHLAHAFLTGRAYRDVEAKYADNNPPPMARVVKILNTFAQRPVNAAEVEAWLKAAPTKVAPAVASPELSLAM